MDKLKDMGIWIAGTSDKATQGLYDSDLKGPIALVMGSEGKGMRRLTEEKCDFLLTIPMEGVVPCLNVSVATGVYACMKSSDSEIALRYNFYYSLT